MINNEKLGVRGTWFTILLEKQDIHMTENLKKILKSILVVFLRATESAWKPFQGCN